MRYCQNCGDAIRENSRYCKSCGTFLQSPDKFFVEEESGKFCQKCGAAIVKQYCPQCGSYAKKVNIKTNGLNMGKFIGNVGNQNKGKKTGVTIQKGDGSVTDLFASAFSVKEDLKITALNAGLFAIMLTFLLGVLVFIINAGMVSKIMGTVKTLHPNLEILAVKGIEKVLDFKAIIWSLFTGTAMTGTLSDGINIDVTVKGVMPFLVLPILVLLIWLIEVVRKAAMKTERTFYMALMQSGIFAFLASIVTMLFSYKRTYTSEQTSAAWTVVRDILQNITDFDIADHVTVSGSADLISVFFTIFFCTLLSLLILPGLKVENEIWKEIRNSVTIFLGVVLCMTVIPGVVTAIIVLSKLSGINILGGIVLFLFLSGMYAVSIFTGNTQWCHLSVQGISDAGTLDIKNTWTKGITSFTLGNYSGNETSNAASLPVGVLHICLIIIGVIAVLYLAAKVWKNLSCNWSMAAVISVIAGSGCAVFLTMLQKLFRFGGELDTNIASAQYYLGKNSIVSNFLKETIVIVVLCMAAYAIWSFLGTQITAYLNAKKEWILIGVCICSLCVSFIVVSGIKLKSFRPLVESYVTTMYDGSEETDSYESASRAEVINRETSEAMQLLDKFFVENKGNVKKFIFGNIY